MISHLALIFSFDPQFHVTYLRTLYCMYRTYVKMCQTWPFCKKTNFTWYCPQSWHVQQQLSPSICFFTLPGSHWRLQTDSGWDGFSNWNCNSEKKTRQKLFRSNLEKNNHLKNLNIFFIFSGYFFWDTFFIFTAWKIQIFFNQKSKKISGFLPDLS